MFRMWGKIWKDNRIKEDMVIEINDFSLSRTQMVFQALDEICSQFDLEKPIWLDSNIKEFQLRVKTRFNQDNFIEILDFQYLEIQILEEAY